MAKKDKKANHGKATGEVAELKRKLNKLRKKLKAERDGAEASPPVKTPAPAVSPLAPKDGFPSIPPIEGLRLSAVAAGVKYKNRKDVMLVRLAPGTAVAGVFTKSTTRAACVLDCQAKGRPGLRGAVIGNEKIHFICPFSSSTKCYRPY